MDDPYSLVFPKWISHNSKPVSCVTVHPSGDFFATGGWDTYVKIWNFEPLIDPKSTKVKLLALLHDHTSSVNCVRFSPDGKYLASAGDDSQVFLWQRVPSIGKPNTFGIPENELTPNKPVQTWTSRVLSAHSQDVTSVSWSADSQRIVSCSIDGVLIVWDVKSYSQIWKSKREIGISSVAWDPLNRFIVAQQMNLHLVVYDVQGNFIKEVQDCLEEYDQALALRIAWSPDGSFVGAANGSKDTNFISPFFQRESFNFAFALEGHVAPINCLSCPPFLLKTGDQSYSSLFALVDKCGVLSIWLIGSETKPLFIMDQISNLTSYDLAWSKDGKWLFIALSSNPVTGHGGLMCIHFLKDFQYPMADFNEMDEIKARLLGETSFRLKSKYMQNVANILQSLEVKEKEVDLEVLQLTTEEVKNRQGEDTINGIRVIHPVLLTAVEKQLISFQCNVECDSIPNIPYELTIQDLNWPKPAALPVEPSHVIIYKGTDEDNNADSNSKIKDLYNPDYCVIVASGVCIYKLSYRTGQRIASPFCIGSKCRHLSVSNGVVLAVGDKCYVLNLESMQCTLSCECPNDFVNFGIVNDKIIIGHSQGKYWVYDSTADSWVGGGLTQNFDDASMEEIERFAQMNEHEVAASQWYDFGISAIFQAYHGKYDEAREFLSAVKEKQKTDYARNYIEKLEETLKNKWGSSE